jgi:predicted O-methyltransferase YrrM
MDTGDPDITDADRGAERAQAAVAAITATRKSNVNALVRSAISSSGGYRFPPIAGQVTTETHFGSLLYSLASEPDVKLVLEIGTWNSGGSSLCIGKGLKDSGTGFLFTMEAVEDQWIQVYLYYPQHL